jgi:hypothetical protein
VSAADTVAVNGSTKGDVVSASLVNIGPENAVIVAGLATPVSTRWLARNGAIVKFRLNPCAPGKVGSWSSKFPERSLILWMLKV